MPHIDKTIKDAIDNGHMKASEAGHLTYVFYKEGLQYMNRKGESYSNYCHVIGSLICAGLELYRRKIALYEDKKIAENGAAD